MGLANVSSRFASMRAEAGTVAEKVHAVLTEAAEKINTLAEDSPVLMSIIQHLEQAAHVTVSAPALQVPAQSSDPTPAGTNAPAATSEEATTSTPSSSTTNSTDSAPTSSTASEG